MHIDVAKKKMCPFVVEANGGAKNTFGTRCIGDECMAWEFDFEVKEVKHPEPFAPREKCVISKKYGSCKRIK